ncbi:hypothetical protein BP5796_09553 [Coleophoma crateriformis]|uniref:NCT transcriptional regulatory complex subunit B n=1 Tax=Coleophoma crateriformis TaxID=565419 RepID=A0A3D8QZ14_9HELO|nr:hypothetical protein BP5796_09553 [Coleophoma crateriformis]
MGVVKATFIDTETSSSTSSNAQDQPPPCGYVHPFVLKNYKDNCDERPPFAECAHCHPGSHGNNGIQGCGHTSTPTPSPDIIRTRPAPAPRRELNPAVSPFQRCTSLMWDPFVDNLSKNCSTYEAQQNWRPLPCPKQAAWHARDTIHKFRTYSQRYSSYSCNLTPTRLHGYSRRHSVSTPPSSPPKRQHPQPICNNPWNPTVQKIVTEILPSSSGLAFGKDARDLLIECCVEFITLISSEANEISEKESKKTIACEHITKALEQLDFGEYVQFINEVANEHKEQLKGREKKANKLEQSGLSTEQLLAMQEEAFRDAAQRHG